MKIFDKLKQNAKLLKKQLTVLYFAYRNPELKVFPKLLIIFTLGYALSPIDLIPDFIPILGYIDDLLILPLLITLSVKSIPSDIIIKAKEQANNEKITLKKNYVFAILFIIIWVIIIRAIIIALI